MISTHETARITVRVAVEALTVPDHVKFHVRHRRQGTPKSVVDRVRGLIAGYKKPKYVFIVDELPRNSLGKVLKGQLRDKVSGLIDAEALPEIEKSEPALPIR